jgi:5-methyltetrahydrofolate--homocysteine methyltransferase
MQDELRTVAQAVTEGDDTKVVALVSEALEEGTPASVVLQDGLVPGLQTLGERFKDGTVFLPEVLIACRAMNAGVDVLKPHFSLGDRPSKGIVVLGTVEGDMHDIGKNLVKLMLESSGFDVEDLGTDVPSEDFVAAARDTRADVVAMSALLTITMSSMSDTVRSLEDAGLRDSVKVLIGGAPVTREFADEIGADGFAEDCVSAVDEAARLMQNRGGAND